MALPILYSSLSTTSREWLGIVRNSKVLGQSWFYRFTSFGWNLSKNSWMKLEDTAQNLLWISSKKMAMKLTLQAIAKTLLRCEVRAQIRWVLRRKGRDGVRRKQSIFKDALIRISSLLNRCSKLWLLSLADQAAPFHPKFKNLSKPRKVRRLRKTLWLKRPYRSYKWIAKASPNSQSSRS